MKSMAGFTLIECLIALIVLGLGAALAMQDSWSGVWAAKQGWQEAQALRLAQSVASEAGIALAVPEEGIDMVEPGLPFRIKVRPDSQDARPVYRVEVFKEPGGQLLATLLHHVQTKQR